jgi:hypothetical protein
MRPEICCFFKKGLTFAERVIDSNQNDVWDGLTFRRQNRRCRDKKKGESQLAGLYPVHFLGGLFMKKIISLLVILALFASTAFAVPLSVAASFPEPTQTVVSSEQTQAVSEAFSAIDETGNLFADALFADVGGTPLTTSEAQLVDGGIPIPLIIVAVVVAVSASSCATLNKAVRK